jgi:hypothetical protein
MDLTDRSLQKDAKLVRTPVGLHNYLYCADWRILFSTPLLAASNLSTLYTEFFVSSTNDF